MQIDGNITHDHCVIKQHVVQYFSDLFTSTRTHAQRDFSLIHRLITPAQNSNLTCVPSAEEIKTTVFSMDPDSSSGPDGYSGRFYHTTWDIIHTDITEAVSYFFRHGHIPVGLNSSFLVMIPKIAGACKVHQFRPIILSNFLFKIITKILATRLGETMKDIITANQFGFIPGIKEDS